MAATAITVQDINGPFDDIDAGGADFTWTAADVANGNSFACTGKELLLVRNTDESTAYYVTIDSVEDEKNREGDISQYSLAAGDFAVFGVGLTTAVGWRQSTNVINITGENAAVEFAVLRLPN
jgi:hypothetical protein